MRKLMIVMALLVVGCLPKGYYTPQYHGPDAAAVVLYGDYYGDFILDGNVVEPVAGRIAVSPGRHTLSYKLGNYLSVPFTREYVSGGILYLDILPSWNGDYFAEMTRKEYDERVKNDQAKRAEKF